MSTTYPKTATREARDDGHLSSDARQHTATTTVIELSVSAKDVTLADEYIVQVNGVQVARWRAYSRNAQRAGLNEVEAKTAY